MKFVSNLNKFVLVYSGLTKVFPFNYYSFWFGFAISLFDWQGHICWWYLMGNNVSLVNRH